MNNIILKENNSISKNNLKWGQYTKSKTISILIFYFIFYLFIISSIPYIFLEIFPNTSLSTIDAINFICQLFSLIIVLIISKNIFKSDLINFKNKMPFIIFDAFRYYVIIYFFNIVFNILLSFIGSSAENQQALEQLISNTPYSYIFMAIIVAPILEEFIFRGTIFRNIYKKNKYLAYIISTLLFGLLHVMSSILSGNWINAISIISYLNIGYFFAKFYDKHKSIYASVLLHFINNTTAVILLEIVKRLA
ncbi:MAG: CPBP family intramembrane metalloprotease [Erysipelotrichaceae bacterium]|nr:CPBP family intramembrane metalloprotease [Erysipelotrichaceae bacterium]